MRLAGDGVTRRDQDYLGLKVRKENERFNPRLARVLRFPRHGRHAQELVGAHLERPGGWRSTLAMG
jgi:hypothetical protein